MKYTWKHTLYASYAGYITQAIVNNLAPLLFLIFQDQYSVSAGQLGLLIGFNFTVQMLIDLLAAHFAGKIGYRPLVVAAHLFCSAGLIALGLLPGIFLSSFGTALPGLLLAVFLYALGGGLIEVLISPIVEALPGEEKASAMSLLHSFYCWGHMGVVLLSTLFFQLFSAGSWMWLPLLWSLLPLLNAAFFARVPLRTLEDSVSGETDSSPSGPGALFRLRLLPLFFLLMICSGAAEQAMSQWASYFAEAGLGISKTLGDLAGPCMFALFMGLSRLYYGKYGSRIRLYPFLLISCGLCALSYLLAALSPAPWMALGGDIGCAAGPFAAGLFASSDGSLTRGLLFSVLFPLVLAAGTLYLLHISRRPAPRNRPCRR